MNNFSKKFKVFFKDAVFFVVFALAVFSILFYLTRWNTEPVFEKASEVEQPETVPVGQDDKTLAAKWGISLADYNIWADQNGINWHISLLASDPDGDELPNYLEYLHGTDPKNTDTDGDGFTDRQEITNGYDPDAPGDTRPTVEITSAKMNISAPMVWSNSENEQDQLKNLQNGVAHFAKTAAPGQAGNMIISGHSSNYAWAKGNFNHIFEKLNNLLPGDVIDVKTVQQNGRIITYHYQVSGKFTTVPNDARIFETADVPVLTLSTCWPLGTNLRRLIVKAEIVK